jgi:hypothetical protein
MEARRSAGFMFSAPESLSGATATFERVPMKQGKQDTHSRQYQSDERLAGRAVSAPAFPDLNEIDTLTLAMRQLMQLPGMAKDTSMPEPWQ